MLARLEPPARRKVDRRCDWNWNGGNWMVARSQSRLCALALLHCDCRCCRRSGRPILAGLPLRASQPSRSTGGCGCQHGGEGLGDTYRRWRKNGRSGQLELSLAHIHDRRRRQRRFAGGRFPIQPDPFGSDAAGSEPHLNRITLLVKGLEFDRQLRRSKSTVNQPDAVSVMIFTIVSSTSFATPSSCGESNIPRRMVGLRDANIVLPPSS